MASFTEYEEELRFTGAVPVQICVFMVFARKGCQLKIESSEFTRATASLKMVSSWFVSAAILPALHAR